MVELRRASNASRAARWVVAGLLAVAACDDGDGREAAVSTTPGPGATAPAGVTSTIVPTSPAAEPLRDIPLAAEPFADISRPTAMVTRPVDGSIYISTQEGQIWEIGRGTPPEVVLDLAGTVSAYEPGSERGLLGLSFHPNDGRVFVYYTDLTAQSHLVSYALDADGAPDAASVWDVLVVEQPGVGHKGGGMSFDADGVLYLALGDGGGSDGRDAQDYTKLLGGIVRIVPNTTGPGYTNPADNPWPSDATRRPELWAKGLRNPWGFWRDPVTGDLWMGDVGNNTVEEVDRIPAAMAGANLGWYFIEGDQVNHDGAPPDALAPIFTYRHDEIGPAVIGGRIYRGDAIPSLRGAYVFADMAGRVMAIGAGDETVTLTVSLPGVVITGFGEGPDGELYVLTLQGGVLKIVPT